MDAVKLAAASSVAAPPPASIGSRSLHSSGFAAFWLGQSVSVLGDAFAMVATPLLVLQATHSVATMGLLTATAGIGHILAGVLSGVIVDRVDRRRLMILCDLVRMVVWAAVPIVWLLVGPRIGLLFVATALSSLFGNAFQVAAITAVPDLVGRHEITAANGRIHASFAFMYLLGPMLSGLVCQRFGPVTALGIDAASFAVSAASMLFVRLRQRPKVTAPRALGVRHAADELLAGVRFLFAHPLLRAVTILLGTSTLLVAARLDLYVFFAKHDLHRSDGDVGRLFALGAAGAVLGGLAASRLRQRFGFAVCWLGAGFLLGIATIASAWAPSITLVVTTLAFGAFADSIRGINSMSVRQEVTPEALLGRVTAAFWTLANVMGPLGAALLTALAAHTNTRTALAACGAGIIAVTFLGLFTAIAAPEGRQHGRTTPAG